MVSKMVGEAFRIISKPGRLRARVALHVSPLVAAGILLFGGYAPAWSEENIGGAVTVINLVQGDLPAGNQVPVVQGDSVFLNEAVRSGADSKAKLVLKDNTNVTVGPGSTIKLDNFTYSGPQASGTIALNLTKGTLRFVTGDASKRSYTIWTPTAAIGVRGTIFRAKVTDTGTELINEEGRTIVCKRIGDYTAQQIVTRFCRGALPTHKTSAVTDADISPSKSCPCVELILPGQAATVTSNGIAVTQAPLDAISEPIINEGFAFSGAGLAGAGLVSAAVIGGITAAAVSSSSHSPSARTQFESP
jgi:F0F1-type ATP synthase membrane subunit c/vacuolar-type H+-ATPase subunit K